MTLQFSAGGQRLVRLANELQDDSEALLQILLELVSRKALGRILNCPTYPLVRQTEDLAQRVGVVRSMIEQNVYDTSTVLGILYERARNRAWRKQRGQFFTPYPEALKTIERIGIQEKETILDLGPGTGVFPIAIFQLENQIARTVSYLGIENDPLLALCTAISLDTISAPVGWRILYSNFLTLDPEYFRKMGISEVDVIISNPPFVRHHAMRGTKSVVNRIAQRAGVQLSGYSGMHSFFLAHASQLVKPRGRMAFIFPIGMSEINHGMDVLAQLKTINFDIDTKDLNRDLKLFILKGRGKKIDSEEQNNENANLHPLKSFASVHRGISTGANWFFLINTDIIANYKIPERFLRKVLPTRVGLKQSNFTKSDWERLADDGLACWLLEIPKNVPTKMLPLSIQNYLKIGESKNVPFIWTCKHRDPWYSVPASNRRPPDFIFTYITQGNPRFIHNEANVDILTNVLGVYLNQGVVVKSAHMSSLAESLTNDLKEWMKNKGVGRRYSEGLLKFEPCDLQKLPLLEATLNLLSTSNKSLEDYLE